MAHAWIACAPVSEVRTAEVYVSVGNEASEPVKKRLRHMSFIIHSLNHVDSRGPSRRLPVTTIGSPVPFRSDALANREPSAMWWSGPALQHGQTTEAAVTCDEFIYTLQSLSSFYATST